VPRVVGLAPERAKIDGVSKGVVGIGQLSVVKYVRKSRTSFDAHTLGNHDVLLDAEVHVPEGLAAEIANTAVMTVVNSEDRVAEAVVNQLPTLLPSAAPKDWPPS
jgi:hypothetical protein